MQHHATSLKQQLFVWKDCTFRPFQSWLAKEGGLHVILSFEQHPIPFDTVADSSVRLKNPYPACVATKLRWQATSDESQGAAQQGHSPFFLPKCVTQMIRMAVSSDTPLVVRCQIGSLGHGHLLLFCSLKSKLPCCQVSHPRIDCNKTWSTPFV